MFRWGTDSVVEYLVPLVANGLSSVLLFGVVSDSRKNDEGSFGEHCDNPVMTAVANIRAR